MPHVIVKMIAGRTDQQKKDLAEQMTQVVINALQSKTSSISVSIEDVASDKWDEAVLKPDILDKPDTLYKKPGYGPFADKT